MKFSLNRGRAILFSIVLFCFSCGDADLFDTDKWSDQIEGWEPGVQVKIVNGSFTLWDLINQGKDSVIVKEGNNLIIQYTKGDVYKMPVSKVFTMPETGDPFEVELPDLSLPTGQLQDDYDMDFPLTAHFPNIPDGCELTDLQLSGQFVCNFPYAGFDYDATITFENIKQGNDVFVIYKQVTATDQTGSYDWSKADLNLNGEDVLNLTLNMFIPQGTNIGSDLLGNLTFHLTDLKFEEALGKIKVAQPITIDPGSFDMNIDFFNEIQGDFKFAEPELNLVIRNKGIGVPVALDMAFENQGSTLKLASGSTLLFRGNPSNDQFITEVHGLNKNNSNIVDFLSMPPKGDIEYSGLIEVNPEDRNDNKIFGDGEIAVDANIRIPFTLSANELSYKDTLNDIDIDQKYADKIKEGTIKIFATNSLPLKIQIPSLVLLAENGETLVLTVDENSGEGIKANGDGEITYQLNREQAKFLGKTKSILLQAVASTPGNEVQTIPADAKLSFSLVIRAKAIIDNLNDF